MLRVNTCISFDVMTRLVIFLTMIFASLVFHIPLLPARVFTILPLICLVVENVVWRLIFYQSMLIAEVRITAMRIQVKVGTASVVARLVQWLLEHVVEPAIKITLPVYAYCQHFTFQNWLKLIPQLMSMF